MFIFGFNLPKGIRVTRGKGKEIRPAFSAGIGFGLSRSDWRQRTTHWKNKEPEPRS